MSKRKSKSKPQLKPAHVAYRQEAMDHAWNWFQFHAGQRMQMLRFYLTTALVLAAATGYLWRENEHLMTLCLSLFGVVAMLSFWRLDRRISRLVKLGEEALKTQQKSLGAEEFKLCQRADSLHKPTGGRKHIWPYTYSENACALFCFGALVFALVAYNSCTLQSSCSSYLPSGVKDTPAVKKAAGRPIIRTGVPVYN